MPVSQQAMRCSGVIRRRGQLLKNSAISVNKAL